MLTLTKLSVAKELYNQDFKSIIDKYTFIGDFRQKEALREISKELFFKYPFFITKGEFPIEYDFGMNSIEMPTTLGDDRPTEHINKGRLIFQQGKYEEARNIWLSSRHRYGTTYPSHRRNDYFIAMSFLQISHKILQEFKDIHRNEVRLSFSNVATFLAWAFLKKRDVKDDLIDQLTPKGLYNLAAINYTFGRHVGAHGAAQEGLDFLRKTGRNDYRNKLRQVIVETWILDHNYIEAMQELDTMIRQDPNPKNAARGFARAADIYFDLNNYELAEELYQLANRTYLYAGEIDPNAFILRGESLFWLKRFAESAQMFEQAFQADDSKRKIRPLPISQKSWAKLRLADARLAMAENKQNDNKALFEKAQLAYYQVSREFPNTEASKLALVRQACISLPGYLGNNVKHARKDLSEIRQMNMPTEAIELAWSCELNSLAQTERNVDFTFKVKEFLEKFPNSRFALNFISPLKIIRADKIDEFFTQNDDYSAILFYERNKSLLFTDISEHRQAKLWLAYVRTGSTAKAKPFWQAYQKSSLIDQNHLWTLTYLAESKQQNDLIAFMREKDIQIPLDTNGLIIWHRLLATRLDKNLHKLFLQTTNEWAKNNVQNICSYKVPLISRLSSQKIELETIALELAKDIKILFPKIFTTNLSCARELLDLEINLARVNHQEASYAKQWFSRLDWPFKKIQIPFLWSAAKFFIKADLTQEADKMLKILANFDPKQFQEANFAKLELEKNRREVDKFWNK